MSPVPLRGARHLPADGHARGTGRPQEGHDRGRPQRAPGQPLARRAGRPTGADIASSEAELEQQRAHARPAAACSSRPCRWTTSCPMGLPQGKADNQILGVVQSLRKSTAARCGAGVQGHQHAHQGARAGPAAEDYYNDKTLDDLDLLYSACSPARGLLGPSTARPWRAGSSRPAHLLPHHRADRAQPADQPVRLLRGARRAAPLCARDRDQRQDRGAQDAEGLQPPEERRSGASPRATASRTSR